MREAGTAPGHGWRGAGNRMQACFPHSGVELSPVAVGDAGEIEPRRGVARFATVV